MTAMQRQEGRDQQVVHLEQVVLWGLVLLMIEEPHLVLVLLMGIVKAQGVLPIHRELLVLQLVLVMTVGLGLLVITAR